MIAEFLYFLNPLIKLHLTTESKNTVPAGSPDVTQLRVISILPPRSSIFLNQTIRRIYQMNTITSQLTIVFDPPFYKAIFERRTKDSYEVAQVVLGSSEPKTPLITDLVINKWSRIQFFEATSDTKSKLAATTKVNPKRLQRLARKTMTSNTSSKAQAALKKAFEKSKQTQKHSSVLQKAVVQEQEYRLRKSKRIEKHKGH